jgi:ABC-type branched-subunit amino acid transport system substrate-binding protein
MSVIRKFLIKGFLGLVLVHGGLAQAQDVKIGAVFPLSGPNGSYGDIFMSGANLAVDDINADHWLQGKLSIAYEDSQGTPQRGVVAMNKLVNVDKVPYVLSSFTGVLKATAPIGQRTQTPILNGSGIGPDLAGLGSYFWSVLPFANHEVEAVIPYLVKEQNLKRFALLYIDDSIGQALRKQMETTLPTLGGTLVTTMSVPATLQQFSSIAAKIREAKPDVVYIASWGAQQLQIVKQLRQNGVTQQLVSYSAFALPEIEKLPEAKGTLFTSQHIDLASQDPVTKRFVDEFKTKYGKNPTVYNVNYYNGVRLFGLLASALQKQGKPITGSNLLAQREQTKSFDLVGGNVAFQADGKFLSAIQVNRIENGSSKMVTVISTP